MDQSYKGDVSPSDCWAALSEDQGAFLVDVRTGAEWSYVGFPVLASLGKTPLFAEWQTYPSMAVDPDFASRLTARIEAEGGSRQSPIYFLCRSGVRSIASAVAMTEAGFAKCFNVLDGFEGPPDSEGHRGQISGWKATGLPWAQK